jgi:hypothetical protein
VEHKAEGAQECGYEHVILDQGSAQVSHVRVNHEYEISGLKIGLSPILIRERSTGS